MLYKIVDFFETYVMVWHVNVLSISTGVDLVFLVGFSLVLYVVIGDFWY